MRPKGDFASTEMRAIAVPGPCPHFSNERGHFYLNVEYIWIISASIHMYMLRISFSLMITAADTNCALSFSAIGAQNCVLRAAETKSVCSNNFAKVRPEVHCVTPIGNSSYAEKQGRSGGAHSMLNWM